MGPEFGSQPSDLEAASHRFDEAAEIVAASLAELRAALEVAGAALGDDEQGRAFAARYQPLAAEGLTSIGREAAALGSIGPALRATAREQRAADDAAVGTFRPPVTGPP